MLEIMGKTIDLEKSELLYSEPAAGKSFPADWTVYGGE